jgi:DNA-binding winged helix-turn-helix (wHTH) protein
VSPPFLTRVPYRFSIFEADPQSGELRKNGVRLRIQDQPFQILLRLLERPGQIVTREELKTTLWSGDTFVDFDNGLNMAVKRLREVLGDDAERPNFIETIPRRGYRFIGALQSRELVAQVSRSTSSKVRTLRLSVAAVIAALCAEGIWSLSRIRSEVHLPPIEVVPLAGLNGFESEAAFSSHGNHVAFANHSPEGVGIYVTTV